MNRAQPAKTAQRRRAEPDRSLWQAVARSVRDNVIAEFAVQGLRLAGLVVLARALRPEDFGVFRVLLVVSVLVTLSNDAGIPDALIQRKEITAAHEATAWWLSVLTALIASLILYVTAPAIAAAMQMPQLCEDARLLCLPILLNATAVVASARLRRGLNFSALAAADVLAEVAFLAVALLLLWRGMPMWSLPGGLAARVTVRALVIWAVDRQLPRGLPTLQAARDFAHFAVAAWSSRFAYVLSSNADYLLVGRLLGSSALGFYSMAWDLLRFVPDRLHRVAGRVTFPTFCLLQDNREELARAYLDFYDYMARVVLPIAVCAAIAAPEILHTVYGPQWTPSALPMRLLATGLALSGLRLGIGSIYYSNNRPALDLYLHGVRLGLLVVTVVGLSRWGLFGISLGMSAVESVVSVAGQSLACALIGLTLRDLVRPTVRALRLAMFCGLSTLAGRTLAILAGAGSATELIAAAVPPALVYLWLERSNAADLIARAFAPGARGASIEVPQPQA
ncbi:MAG TPA: lipopolysaccharide biosynthesis protein [Candidatus Binataceae bacterium]|nr:lipopolysaccharide biosynthesis protein [Candidatus Binataceae bacterium]